jgi:hypothetical protein
MRAIYASDKGGGNDRNNDRKKRKKQPKPGAAATAAAAAGVVEEEGEYFLRRGCEYAVLTPTPASPLQDVSSTTRPSAHTRDNTDTHVDPEPQITAASILVR